MCASRPGVAWPITTVELFFDLVCVFAIAQLRRLDELGTVNSNTKESHHENRDHRWYRTHRQ